MFPNQQSSVAGGMKVAGSRRFAIPLFLNDLLRDFARILLTLHSQVDTRESVASVQTNAVRTIAAVLPGREAALNRSARNSGESDAKSCAALCGQRRWRLGMLPMCVAANQSIILLDEFVRRPLEGAASPGPKSTPPLSH